MDILSYLDISVEEGVYRPDDDSSMLIGMIELNRGERVLEIGCGSGIISIHCAIAGGLVTACDINRNAVRLTEYNAEENGVKLQNLLVGNMFESLDGLWDVIIFNPPYLPVLDKRIQDFRWDGGEKGDETVIKFLEEGWKYMHSESRIYFCCSDMSPMSAIRRVMERYYTVNDMKEKKYDFETLYGFELKRITH